MILGFSHFTLRCGSIDLAVPELEKLGYTVDFVQRTVKNPEGKRPFLKEWAPEMSIALLRGQGTLPVELVQYPWDAIGSVSAFEPVLSTQPTSASRDRPIEATLGTIFDAESCIRGPKGPFGVAFWEVPRSERGFVGFIQRTSDLDRASHFWANVPGCKVKKIDSADGPIAQVRFAAALKTLSLTIALMEDPSFPDAPGSMDGAGTSCLSFISSSVTRDSAAIHGQASYPTSGFFDIEINQRPLKLEIFQPLPGLFFELLEAPRKPVIS